MSIACQLIGHRYRYRAEGPTVRWECVRGCGDGGSRDYDSSRRARRHAAALNRHERGLSAAAPRRRRLAALLAGWRRR